MNILTGGLLWLAAQTLWGAGEEQIVRPIKASDNGAAVAAEYQAEIADAERLGRIIFEHDIAAARATDFIIDKTRGKLSEDVRGWIEAPLEDGAIRIYFFGEAAEGEFFPVYAVDVRNGEAVKKSYTAYTGRTPFETPLNNLAKARAIALRQPFNACSRNYNSVVFENAPGEYFVYLLAGTRDPGVIPFGGHYRMTVNPDENAIIGFQAFSKSCLIMRKDQAPKGSTAAALMVSHIVTPYPMETHAWLSLLHEIDIYVMTADNGVLWKVSKGQIEALQD